MNDEDAQYEQDHAARRLEVERAFRALLERSGAVLESLDVISATRSALEFFRDARFDWLNTDENTSISNVTIDLEYEATPLTNPLMALFSKPKPSPLEQVRLSFQRDLDAVDEDVTSFSLELEFAPEGLDALEEMDAYTNDADYESFEDFARAVLTNPSLVRLAELRPRSVSMTTD